jgi:hypothetical protein
VLTYESFIIAARPVKSVGLNGALNAGRDQSPMVTDAVFLCHRARLPWRKALDLCASAFKMGSLSEVLHGVGQASGFRPEIILPLATQHWNLYDWKERL